MLPLAFFVLEPIPAHTGSEAQVAPNAKSEADAFHINTFTVACCREAQRQSHTQTHTETCSCIVPKLAREADAGVNVTDESTQRKELTAALVGWATFIHRRRLVPGRDGMCFAAARWTRGSERTDVGTSWTSIQLPHSSQHWATPPNPPRPWWGSVRPGYVISTNSFKPSRDELAFTCWWAKGSPTHNTCTQTHTHTHSEGSPHACQWTPIHTHTVMVC